MRVLIVTVFFPPKNSIASLRPYSWAKHFARLGHDVTVLTTRKIDDPNDIEMPRDSFQVIEVGVPGMSLLSRFLGPRTPMASFDASSQGSAKQGIFARIRRGAINRFRSYQQTYGIMFTCRMPEIHDLWLFPASRRIPSGTWDLVITTSGPYCVHFIGWLLKKTKRAKSWVADWRDLWVENHIYPGLPVIRRVEAWLEDIALATADYCTTVSSPLARILTIKRKKAPVEVIYNGFDEEDYISLITERIFPQDEKLRIVYTGTIYPGKQDPTPLFTAIASLRDRGLLSPEKIEIIFASKLFDVGRLAAQMGVTDFVSSVGFLPRPTALRMQRDADALLFLEFELPGTEGILTGKLFEYLHATPPILAIGISTDATVSTLIQKTGKGHALGNDADKIGAWLEHFVTHGAPPPAPSAQMDISSFSREFQAKKLLGLISPAQGKPL